MIANHLVQTALISLLKSKATILATLVDSAGVAHPGEIREDEWQGDDFDYPNIRVDLGTQEDAYKDGDCTVSNITFSILVFSESSSSKEADTIAGIIKDNLHKKSISSGTAPNRVKFVRIGCTLVPAIRRDERTWRSEVICRTSIHLL